MTTNAIGRFRQATICLVVLLGSSESSVVSAALPKFTEEREAAALYFVKKNCPELVPLLDELKKSNRANYEQEIREIFQTTELLADIPDERRHQLELKIWKTENRALIVVARIAAAKDDEKKPLVTQLRDLAKDLVELEIHALEIQADQLEKDLGETKDELGRLKDNLEKSIMERFDHLLDKGKKRKK